MHSMQVLQTDKGPNRENSNTARQIGGSVIMREGTPPLSHLLLPTHINGSRWFWLSPYPNDTCFPHLQIYSHGFYGYSFGGLTHTDQKPKQGLLPYKNKTSSHWHTETKGNTKDTQLVARKENLNGLLIMQLQLSRRCPCTQRYIRTQTMLQITSQEEWIPTSLSLVYWQNSHKGQRIIVTNKGHLESDWEGTHTVLSHQRAAAVCP